ADERGRVADEENHRMPELLKVPQLAHQYRVPQVQVGRSWVKSGLYAQRPSRLAAFFQALPQVAHADNLRRALLEQIHLLVNRFERAHLVFQYKFQCTEPRFLVPCLSAIINPCITPSIPHSTSPAPRLRRLRPPRLRLTSSQNQLSVISSQLSANVRPLFTTHGARSTALGPAFPVFWSSHGRVFPHSAPA